MKVRQCKTKLLQNGPTWQISYNLRLFFEYDKRFLLFKIFANSKLFIYDEINDWWFSTCIPVNFVGSTV